MSEFKVDQEVTIPSSDLGSRYGIGKIVAIWSNKIAVDFSGHLGHYTIENHEIYPVKTIMGVKFAVDTAVPDDEIHVRY